MDILTHTLSGIAVASVVINYSKIDRYRKAALLIIFGAIGGALPDIDAFSMWSRFDSTFGRWFGLNNTGREIYFSKFWYSHHTFFHSIAAGILFGFMLGVGAYLLRKVVLKKTLTLTSSLRSDFLLLLTFFLGFAAHLFGDMPTPSGVWGGVQLFWPIKNFIGGTGQIWWWNNYDIFLIISICIVINTSVFVLSRMYGFKSFIFSSIIFIGSLFAINYQINHRDFDFNYTGFAKKYEQYELKSKEIQKQILGPKLYLKMSKFDNKVKVNF
jgi:hypothetical protein